MAVSQAPEREAIDRAVSHLVQCQSDAGSLHGPYDGPLFLTPGYVFAHYATRKPIPEPQRDALIESIGRVQSEDGGFGLHIEGPSLLFTTTLNYVALRLLGADSPGALAWIRGCGGALATPSWGKYWLAVLRLYDWRGVHPLPPELWLLPRWVPLHPRRMWCHARVIYLALSYLYGRRWQIPDDDLLAAIREEIFVGVPDWRHARGLVRPDDVYVRHSRRLLLANGVLATVEPHASDRLRERALSRILRHVEHEESTTGFVALGPVNKTLNVVVLHAGGSPLATSSLDALPRYLREGERGLTMQAYSSSELWDTALATQALAAAGCTQKFADGARRFILDNQLRSDVVGGRRYHRGPSRGGWPFSTAVSGWPTVDCTAEALVAGLALGGLTDDRVLEAVDFVLGLQNRDGGWPTYERARAPRWLERFNASELFAGVMVDHSYVELTGSALHALTAARPVLDAHRERQVAKAVRRGERFLRNAQRSDGSWEGSWGICFTYGTWFAIRGLRAIGAGPDDPAIRRAVGFLLGKQLPDGGWGESWESCPRREYVHHPAGGQPVMTAWALLSLIQAQTSDARDAIALGVRFLLETQRPSGDWPQRGVAGIFNRTTTLDYHFYRTIFPTWALALATSSPLNA